MIGVALSVAASVLFAAMYYYSTLLAPLDGQDLFAWRMIFTVPVMVLLVTLLGSNAQVVSIARRVRTEPWLAPLLLISSALLAAQLWVFLWAPTVGKALEVSLGYFLLPLFLVLAGRVVFKERLSIWQKLATAAATVGVVHEIWRVGSFPPEVLLIAGGYTLYFMLRRKLKTDHIGGLWFDLVLMMPVAIWMALQGVVNTSFMEANPHFYWLLPGLGVLSATALAAYMLAARYLNLGLFGLLGYLEPVLLVFVALLLGETIQGQEWWTYVPIWLAVGFLAIEGALRVARRSSTLR